jgi:hypothetical protein
MPLNRKQKKWRKIHTEGLGDQSFFWCCQGIAQSPDVEEEIRTEYWWKAASWKT